MKTLAVMLTVLLAVLQYRLWFGDGSVQEVWRLNQDVRQVSTELTRLRNRNNALAAEVADLKSGLDAIEERARSELGMIDADEVFYQFVGEKRTVTHSSTEESKPVELPSVQANANTFDRPLSESANGL